jgi:tRNA/tmRNA/rRNA uracil-C5-methylase (TrmA/RlmC/RlmD family)
VPESLQLGDVVTIDIERVAHGGHCVGRANGQVVFVRHTAPGETVDVEITKIVKGGKLAFGDAVEVKKPSSHRITPACAYAGVCGGCDWQHVDLAYQRQMKTDVLHEQLTRLGKLSADNSLLVDLRVQPLSDDETGLAWRTRVEYATDSRGRAGFRQHNSHDVAVVNECVVAVPSITGDGVTNVPWASNSEVRAVATTSGDVVMLPDSTGDESISEVVAGYTYNLRASNFWQGHKNAPEVFVREIMRMLDPQIGQHILDLYAGAGLFAVPLADAVGLGGRLAAVEGDISAARSLKKNLKPFAQATSHTDDVLHWLKTSGLKKVDGIVLDPPRVGAGKEVVTAIAKLKPTKIVYVACDPASLGRDVALLAELGYSMTSVTAWDAFPMTGHFETIALFQ